MRLQGKKAIVTGAGSRRGIGRAIALGFAREGADVAVADIDENGTREAVREVEGVGRRALAIRCDVSLAADIERTVRQVVEQFGRIDILVNNAGFCEFVPFLEIREELWDRTFAINAKGYFLVGQAVARQMVRQGGGGRIINVSSVSAEMSGEEKVHYCASKAAVKLLTQGMALELSRHRINVNAIAPGTIDTDIIKQGHIQRLVEQERRQCSIPWGRMGTPQDLVGVAVFLASDEGEYLTGSSIVVDGGMLAGGLLPAEFRTPKRKSITQPAP